MAGMLFERIGAGFEATQWSRVIKPGTEGRREALAELCQIYWRPTYCFIRARGFSPDETQDLTQGLFASLLEPGALGRLDAKAGRFRDWLRAAARNFLCNEIKRRGALKRGGKSCPLSLDFEVAEESLRQDAQATLTPDRIFDRQWALTVTARALARVREDFVREGKREAFLRLERLLAGEEDTTDAELAALTGKTPNHLRVERHHLKNKIKARYRQYLREEIGETVVGRDAVDLELRLLLDALA